MGQAPAEIMLALPTPQKLKMLVILPIKQHTCLNTSFAMNVTMFEGDMKAGKSPVTGTPLTLGNQIGVHDRQLARDPAQDRAATGSPRQHTEQRSAKKIFRNC